MARFSSQTLFIPTAFPPQPSLALEILQPESFLTPTLQEGGVVPRMEWERQKVIISSLMGVYDYHHQNLINILKCSFFSINIDESSVNRKSLLDVNVSFIDTDMKESCKRNFTTISMEKGTTASETVDAIISAFEASFIPLENIVTIVTDGCSTMLGEEGGVHAVLRQRLPYLPHWGGCSCHDCSNIQKAGVSKLNPNLTNLFSQLHTYLSTSFLHRMREYQEFCLSQGQQPHRIPDFLDVRFRTITNWKMTGVSISGLKSCRGR